MPTTSGAIGDGTTSVAPSIEIVNAVDEAIDWDGFVSMKIRLQLGSADELELELQAENAEGVFRPDMPAWQVGGQLKISAGYDGIVDHIQTFEIVSTTNKYGGYGESPTMTVRGVSELARAARNRNPRVFNDKDDGAVLAALCAEYGWTNGVPAEATKDETLDLKSKFTKRGRVKAKDTTDLDLLRTMATDLGLGAPRIDKDNTLVMPAASAENPIVFLRGPEASGDVFDALLADHYALLSFSPSREGGADNIQLAIVAWDPEQNKFIEKVFEAGEYGEDPKVIYSGALASTALKSDSSTRGLTLQIIQSRGWNKDERRDILASRQYVNETDAEALAKRWFDLREKLGRWAKIEVEGHPGLLPYEAIIVDGRMANMDKGYWLPTVVEHSFTDAGWSSTATCVRVVDASTISEA